MILISDDFWHKIKMYNFDPYNVFLVIATNIAVLLMTASVLQGHIYTYSFSFSTLKMSCLIRCIACCTEKKYALNLLILKVSG